MATYEKMHVCLWMDPKTDETHCVEIDVIPVEEIDRFFDDIEMYFYNQGGILRDCDYCGSKYPYFPYGIKRNQCQSELCVEKAIQSTEECIQSRKQEEERAAELREKDKRERQERQEAEEQEKIAKQKRETEHNEKVRHGFGYVYIIGASTGLYKIGLTTTTVENRYKSLNLASPIPLTLIHSFESMQVLKVEAYLHSKFKNLRTHGEWFELGESELSWLKSKEDYELDSVV